MSTNQTITTNEKQTFTQNTDRVSNHSPAPSSSPPPQTSDSDDNNGHDQMTDQIMELMRREALRHLEFAWEAERNLVLLCALSKEE
jgi:hypothetical protein